MQRYPMTEKDREPIQLGLEVLTANFDDGIYNHTVGCALLCKNGTIYKGVNCDGIHGSCAEYVTTGTAISHCPDIRVIVNDENGHLIKVAARDLLPFAWQPVIC